MLRVSWPVLSFGLMLLIGVLTLVMAQSATPGTASLTPSYETGSRHPSARQGEGL